jgi:hypothetical protein
MISADTVFFYRFDHIHFGSHFNASSFFHHYKNLTIDGLQKIGIRICVSYYFNTS